MQAQKSQITNAIKYDFKPSFSIKKGEYCMLQLQPCKITEIRLSKGGKHGPPKCFLSGVNIFTDKKIQTYFRNGTIVKIPIVKKYEIQVKNISEDGFISLVSSNGSIFKAHFKFQNQSDQHREFRDVFDQNKNYCKIFYTVIEACDKKRIVEARTAA